MTLCCLSEETLFSRSGRQKHFSGTVACDSIKAFKLVV